MSRLICPLCASPLTRGERTYLCPNGHSFDLAREGYVHLLSPNQKHSKAPGDDKAMVAARVRFLSAGYYGHLLAALRELACRYAPEEEAVLVDSGCGEGYYTAGVAAALREGGRTVRGAGVDISKFALRQAARRDKTLEFAVGSAYRLPVTPECAHLLLNCFSPMAPDEFHRVLRPGGVLFYVVPAPRHLWELKEVLYRTPYENPDEAVPYGGFSPMEVVSVEKSVEISDREDLMALFHMTPYTWNTPREGVERLEALSTLAVTASFRVHVFRRA